MTDQQRETEYVTGTVDSIVTQKGGKWNVIVKTVDSGKYGKKLWTKSADQVATASALIGQTATFECGVSHYTNTETGAPTQSLWINAINPGAPPPQNPVAQAVGVPGPGASPEATGATQSLSAGMIDPRPTRNHSGDPTRVSIERQTALKAAVELYAAGNNGWDAPAILATAKRFADFLETGLPLGEPPFDNALPPDPDIEF